MKNNAEANRGMRTDDRTVSTAEETGQYVTFAIDRETYGVEVRKVHQIVGLSKITPIPNSLPFMRGMINLRGIVIPAVDMRLKFGMASRDYDSFTVILIVELQDRLIGMIVDAVSDVLDIPAKGIQQTPHFSAKINTEYIRAIGNIEGQMVIILDVDMILTSRELDMLDAHGRTMRETAGTAAPAV